MLLILKQTDSNPETDRIKVRSDPLLIDEKAAQEPEVMSRPANPRTMLGTQRALGEDV